MLKAWMGWPNVEMRWRTRVLGSTGRRFSSSGQSKAYYTAMSADLIFLVDLAGQAVANVSATWSNSPSKCTIPS